MTDLTQMTLQGARSVLGPKANLITGTLSPMALGNVVEAYAEGDLLGGVGLIVPWQVVISLHSEVRGRMAHIFQLLPKSFVMDDLSKEWLAHLGLMGDVGGHPAWLAEPPDPKAVDGAAARIRTLEGAFQQALAGAPMVLDPTPRNVSTVHEGLHQEYVSKMDAGYHPLFRWAKQYGMLEAVMTTPGSVPHPQRFPADRIKLEQARARETLEKLRPRKKAQSIFAQIDDDHRAASSPTPPAHTRRLELGVEFKQETHYDDHYYGVDGRGIFYCRPDGSWDTYRGTSHAWEGNAIVARILSSLLPNRGRVCDIGCGSGNFVGYMLDAGWDAVGVDISDSGKKHARDKDVANRIMVADITKRDHPERGYDLVTAWDFWEHVWPSDLDDLIAAVYRMLKLGGVHAAVICTRGSTERDYVYEKGVRTSRENSWLLVAGHVHVRRWFWWARKFKEHGLGLQHDLPRLKLRHDLMNLFQIQRTEDPSLKTAQSWAPRNLLIVEKPK